MNFSIGKSGIIIGDGSGMGFVTRPVSVLVLTVAVLTFLWPMMSKKFRKR